MQMPIGRLHICRHDGVTLAAYAVPSGGGVTLAPLGGETRLSDVSLTFMAPVLPPAPPHPFDVRAMTSADLARLLIERLQEEEGDHDA